MSMFPCVQSRCWGERSLSEEHHYKPTLLGLKCPCLWLAFQLIGKDNGDIIVVVVVVIKGDIQHLYFSYLRFLLRDHLS